MSQFLRYILSIFFTVAFIQIKAQQFVNVIDSLNIFHSLSSTDNWGSGVSFYDIDNDGWDDITFVQEFDSIFFYKNNQGVFSKVSTGIYNDGETKQVLWVDFNNNGLSDLFITTRNGTYKLYKNTGDFQFEDISHSAGFSGLNSNNYGVSFADYDKDGYLDFYICRYYGSGNPSDLSKTNNLYRNNGDGTFNNVTLQAGVGDSIQPSFIGVWLDINNNTWPDLYVINDRSQWGNSLYKNNGDGTFTDITNTSNAHLFGQDPMSGTVGDFNNDAFLDIYMSNTGIEGKEGMLLVNNQDETFTESAQAYGVDIDEWSWGASWVDFDNDTYKDLYVTTARPNTFQPDQRSRFYVNNFGTSFSDAPSFFNNDMISGSYAVAIGDLDNNGFSDLVVQNGKGVNSYLFKNTGGNNNFLKINLKGTVSNKMAIGSWINVYVENEQYVHYTMCGENYMSQNSQNIIFGLADFDEADSIVVTYPSGIIDKYYNVPANSHYFFIEGETNQFSLAIIGDTKLCEGDSVILDAGDFQSYLWNTGDTERYLHVYEGGNYYAEVQNSNNVTLLSDTINVEFLNNLQINLDIYPPSCYESEDGSIIVEVFPSNQEYSIVWDDTLESQNLFGVGEGLYYLNYEDNYGCSFYESYFVEAPQEMNIQTNINFNEVTFLSDVQILVNGGAPPYSYYIDSISTSTPIIDLSDGHYELLIVDANNCIKQDSILIVTPPNFNQITTLQNLNNKVKIFPNPLGEHFFLNILVPSPRNEISIKIFNFLGQVVISKEFHEYQLDLIKLDCKTLLGGIYTVNIKIDDSYFNFKLQK